MKKTRAVVQQDRGDLMLKNRGRKNIASLLILMSFGVLGCGGQAGSSNCGTLSVISGLGGMLASPSYTLGGSIGDGLVAATDVSEGCD